MAGVMMSAKIKVRFAALLYTGVLGYLALNAYTNKEFNYSRHARVSIKTKKKKKKKIDSAQWGMYTPTRATVTF